MSQPSSNKGKDPSGKKFASLNVNQTFKGTKVESRTAAGQTRHGMQSLGKVSQSRRVPIPANLPSLKKENLGNDPTVSLVPAGSSGWGKKEKNATKTEEQPQAAQAKPTKPDQPQEISLRPNAGAGFKNQSEQGKGWGNLQGGTSTAQPPPSSNVFQREFPKLGLDGGGQSTEESRKEQDLDKKGSASNNISNAPQGPAGDKWMAGQLPMSGPGPRPGGPPMDFSMSRDQQRPMFNGAPMQPPTGSQFYPYGPGMVPPPYLQMMPHPFPYPYPNRMPPPGVMGQPPRPPQAVTSESADRPATVKNEDIQNMEDDVDDEGWAGAQEDVDYNVKLKFDESDEEPEMPVQKASTQRKEAKSEQSSSKDDKTRLENDPAENKSRDGPVEAWGDHPPGYQGQMQFRPPPQQWMRGPFPPQFDPSRGPPPQGYPYPPHPWMYMNFRMQMPQQRLPDGTVVTGQPPTSGPPISGPPVSGPPVSGPPVSMQAGAAPSPPSSTAPTDARESERGKPTAAERRKRQEDDERKEAERRGKAQAKLQALEEKIKQREEQSKTRRDSENSSKSAHRERMDSENSDSSRSGTQRSYGDKAGKSTKETPPRFLKQQSLTKASRRDDAAYSPSSSPFEGSAPFQGTDTMPVPRIMKRHDSRSDDASSVHSHDSWVHVASDQEKGKDTEESAFTSDKSQETRANQKHERGSDRDRGQERGPERERGSDRRDRKSERRPGEVEETEKRADKSRQKMESKFKDKVSQGPDEVDGAVEKQASDSNQSVSSKSQRGKVDEREKDSRRTTKSSDRRDSNRDYRSRDEDRSGKRNYEDERRDRFKEDRKNRDKDSGYKSRDRDEATRGMAKKERETATASRRKDSKDETKNGFKQGEQSVMQSQTAGGDSEGKIAVDESGKTKLTETQRPSNREDKKSSDSYRGKDTQTKSKPPPENFKRLEKSKGKGLSMKLTTSKSDDKEKQSAKSNQVNQSDSKKPSAWSRIVSGETAEQGATSTTGKVEAQPKKSLIEIQKEEEQKENERENNKYSNDNVNEATAVTRQDDYDKGDDYDSRRHGKPSRGKKYDERGYEDRGYDDRKNYDKRYGDKRYQERQYEDRRYGDKRYQDKQYEDRRYGDKRSDDKRYEERTGDDRYNRKPRDHYDDRYYDKRDYQDKRENQDKKEYHEKKRSERDSRKTDERFDKKTTDAESNVRKESVSDGKQDQDDVDKKDSYGSRKLGHEDRKRRHDQTETTGNAYERIYSQEVEAEEKGKERRSDSQRPEKKQERGRFSERGRGIRGSRPLYSRGRGRGFSATRTYGSSKEGYPFKEMNRSHSGNISDQSHGSSKEASKVDTSEEGRVAVNKGEELKDDGNKEESKDIVKSKENRDPEKRGGFGVPPRKDETRYESYKDCDRQQVKDYQDRGSYNRRDRNDRSERNDTRRGRGGYNASGSTRHPSKYENKKATKDDKEGSEESKASKSEEKAKAREKNLPEKEGSKDDGSEYEDDDEYTDEEDYEDENGDAEGTTDKKRSESSDVYREEGHRHSSNRGTSRGQSSTRGLRGRYPRDPAGYEGSYKSGVPPRFQRQRNDTNDQRRARGVRVRGSRGRGRASHTSYKTTRGRGFGKPPSSKDPKSKTSISGEKGDEYTVDSEDDIFHSADDSLPSDNEETLAKETRYSRDSGTSRRYNGRGRSSRGSSTRGRGARHGASSDHFLADRQQERVGHIDTSGSAVTLPAAGKASFPGNRAAEDKSRPYSFNFSSTKRGSASTRQGTDHRHGGHPDSQEFSEPPKKMAKSKSMEKPDILRQFDVNNIASVVCIDDMPQNTENAGASSQTEEDDGFVQVTSRKAQKFLREKQKEEEKRKLQEEMNVKTAKRNANDGRESTNKPGRSFKFVDHNQQRVTQTVTQATSQAAVTTVSQSQTSNAAMAAVGGWEPAQALLRGVQMVTPTENLEAGKTPGAPAPPPTMNAWKRPLSFAASLASATVTTSNGAQSVPDPKAVGTGKPNSSPAKQLPVNGQVSQPNDVIMVNGGAVVYKEQINGKDHQTLQDLNIDEASMDSIAADKSDRSADVESKDSSRKSSLGRKTEQRKITKGTKRETAPRFQNMPKAKVTGNEEGLITDGRETNKVSATTEDVQEVGISKLQGEDRAPGKRPNASKLRRCNSESSKEQPENGLIDFEGTAQPTLSFMRADIRTNAEKASAKISKEIKHRDDILESMDQTLGKVEGEIHCREEENAKDTARSVIKSLGDDDEKNLETRSLPSSTPPLVVEIHPPGPKGPSSDPGKGPAMTVPSSMSQEVSEMSMKVLSAKKLWDMPSSMTEGLPVSSASLAMWSEEDKTIVTTSVIATSPTIDVGPQESAKIKEPTPVAVVKAQGVSSKHDEDQSVEVSADTGLISKKTVIEQQNNVCKVKPQQKQQQPIADEKQILPSFSNNQLFASQFPIQPSYALPVHSSASKLPQQPYMLSLERTDGPSVYARERALSDFANHHAQPHAPLSLQQVRPASPISNQQQDVLQTNLMVGNIYGTPALQGTQQNALLWPVISRHAIQPSTSLPYMSHPQSHEPTQDLSSSPATFSSAQLYMAYDQSSQSVFSTQRLNSQMQQTPALGLVLQQPQLRTGSLLNVMQASQNSKDSSMFSLRSSPNQFHQGDLQLMGMSQQSDMTKHVHAKPFQPSSRTPPGSQPSQQPHQHPASFLSQQQAKIPNQINKRVGQPVSLHQQQMPEQFHSSMLHAEKRQILQHHMPQQHTAQQQSQALTLHQTSMQSHSQQSALPHPIRPLALQQSSLQQASGQAQFIQQHAFQGSRIASVGPRSVQGRTVTTPTPLQAQNRLGALSPVDQSMSFIHGGAASLKGISQPHQHSSLIQGSQASSMVPVLQQSQSLPANQHQTRPFTVRPSVQMQSYSTRVAPGPIQRPLRPANPNPVAVSNRPKQPVLPIVKNTDVNQVAKSSLSSGQTSSFRNEEHQKMIEETKKYFAAQQLKNEASILSSIVGGAATPVTTTNTATTPITVIQMTTARPTESIIGKPVEAKPIKSAESKIIRPPESKVIRPPENKAARSAEGKSIKVIESKGMQREVKGSSVESREGKPSESRSGRSSDSRAIKSGDFKGSKHLETKSSKTGDSKPTEEKASSDQKDLRDIAASAQLNDPTDIHAIIKGRPSLAKAFNFASAQDKVSDRQQSKKSQSRDEKPVKTDTRPSSGSSSKGDQKSSAPKGDQKTGVAKPLPQRSGDRSKRAERVRSGSNRGKSSN